MPSSQPRVWLVTGCASPIGEILAQTVLDRGDLLAATDANLVAMPAFTCGDPNRLFTCRLDVANFDEARLAVDAVLARFDRIDVLVNLAAHHVAGPFEDQDWSIIHHLFNRNALGLMAVTQAVLPAMRKQGRGRIINVSTDSGLFGQPLLAAQSAAQYAVEGFSEALSHEVHRFGIRVALVEACGVIRANANSLPYGAELPPPESPYRPIVAHWAAKVAQVPSVDPAAIADAVLRVADDLAPPLRHPVGPPERLALVNGRRQMADESFIQLIRQNL